MVVNRKLIVVADDLGIGFETDRGIIELACKGVVSATVLLVNSPTARQAVEAWLRAGKPCDLGWHPCLTLDKPILAPEQVPSLVDRNGNFWKLNTFLTRWMFGLISQVDVYQEWCAQLTAFREMTGVNPVLVNTHQHVGILAPFANILVQILESLPVKPWVRRVVESQKTINMISGARLKRWFLCSYGKVQAKALDYNKFPGAKTMIGLTDPYCLKNVRFFDECLQSGCGDIVELMCHPGYVDTSLIGRDVTEYGDGLTRRQWELGILGNPQFLNDAAACNYQIVRPSSCMGSGRLAC
jgi:predicted glycoside hydrolase/deacetylase ChbG (UPF0249 family)